MQSVCGRGCRAKGSTAWLAAIAAATVSLALAGCSSGGHIPGAKTDRQVAPPPTVKCPPDLRIGIVQNEQEISIRSKNPITLESGAHPLLVPETTELTLKMSDSIPAISLYHVCVASFLWRDGATALEAARAWKREGYRAELLRRGIKLRIGRRIVDNRLHRLSIGTYADRTDAVNERERLSDAGQDAWIEEELTRAATGTIAVHDRTGTCVGYRPAPLYARSDSPITIKNVNFGFWEERREDRTYGGVLEIGVGKDGTLQVVELVDMETYLAGVVPSEMPASWPQAALKVQAVAARTETLAKIGTRHLADGFDLCAIVHCQAYGGMTRWAPATTEVVQATRGEVLMDGPRPVDTVYSLNCGGHTEHVENVWSLLAEPALRGKLDVIGHNEPLPSPIGPREIVRWVTTTPNVACSEPSSPNNFRWKRQYTADELNKMVSAKMEIGRVLNIVPLDRGVSGRLKSIKVIGTGGERIVRKELAIRSLFGGLYSAAFVVDIQRDQSGNPVTVTFVGAGRGHGVGMCQDGTRGLAARGVPYRRILEHYYTGARIVKLY